MIRCADIGVDVGRRAHERYAATADDLAPARGESTWTMRFRRNDWDVSVVTHTRLTCDGQSFFVDATLDG
ncbi:hypothetical protein ABZY14_35720 [Streptomyces sp. NPDC006617]|uniref:hypothetical protein n=1 Tax=Streptomyces sp. NPDC006617 TaxID=3155354 RepID=UPI0033BF63FF